MITWVIGLLVRTWVCMIFLGNLGYHVSYFETLLIAFIAAFTIEITTKKTDLIGNVYYRTHRF